MIRVEISEINDRIENESDKQRNWLAGLSYAVIGSIVILGGLLISVKFKDAGQKIMDIGKKQIQGWGTVICKKLIHSIIGCINWIDRPKMTIRFFV